MKKKYFWWLVIVFHALFMGKQLLLENSLLQDGKEYLYAADNLRNYGILYAWDLSGVDKHWLESRKPVAAWNIHPVFNNSWLTKRPFLYPCILLLAKTVSFGSKPVFLFLVYLLQNLASLLSIFLVLKIAEKYRNPLPLAHGAIFLLLSLSQVIYANMLMSEIWLQLCMVAVVYILLLKPFDLKNILLVALLLAAAMALKPVMIFTAFCLPLYYLARSFRNFNIRSLLASLLPLLFYLGTCRANEVRTGYYHYSSISTINLLHYNTYTMLLNKYGMHKADSIVDGILLGSKAKKPLYAEQQRFIQSKCAALIKQNSGLYAWLHLRGIAFCLMDPGRFDLTQFFGLPHTENLVYETNQDGKMGKILRIFMNPLGMVLILLMLFNAYKIYVCIRFLFSSALAWADKLIILFFPLYIAFFTGPIGSSRFAMPFMVFLFLAFLVAGGKKRVE